MIDILYLASNRIEFTRASIAALLTSLESHRPNARIVAYVDNDEQGTAGELRTILAEGDEVRETHLGGPVAVTNAFLDSNPSEIFAKIDNDLLLCPSWLTVCLDLMEQNPDVDLLGIEPRCPGPVLIGNGCDRTDMHIGGIGLMRRRAFEGRMRPVASGRYGFTGWQYSFPDVIRAWVNPPLPVFLLDHLPLEPWLTYSAQYREKHWQRQPWGVYADDYSDLWKWWCPPGSPEQSLP